MIERKLLAPFIMLLAALVSVLTMVHYHYDRLTMVIVLLIIMIVFYAVGCFIQKKILQFMKKIEEQEQQMKEQEGAVIEKAAPEEDNEVESEEADSLDEGEAILRERP